MQANHREEIIDILIYPADPLALNSFLRFRGLQFLRIYLEDFIEAKDDHLLEKMMKVLNRLPVGTKNVVDQSAIISVLSQLTKWQTASISVSAKQLIEHWSELEEVMMIEKVRT